MLARIFLFILLQGILLNFVYSQEVEGDWRLYQPKKATFQNDSTSTKIVVREGLIKSISLPVDAKEGRVDVQKDKRIDDLSRFVGSPQNGQTAVTMKGYRVQAFLDRDKNLVNSKRAEYLSRFKDYPAYIDFLAPNFRLRLGDFRTKLDAARFQNEVKEIFPDAIIVMDDIELPVLPK